MVKDGFRPQRGLCSIQYIFQAMRTKGPQRHTRQSRQRGDKHPTSSRFHPSVLWHASPPGSIWVSGVFKIGQFPLVGQGVMANNPLRSIDCLEFKIAVLGR